MSKARVGLTLIVAAALLAGCSYSLPPTLQTNVDEVNQENQDLYNTVSAVKKKANDGGIDGTALNSVERSYTSLAGAYDDWRTQLQRIINNDINNYDADEQYQNAITRLNTTRGDFKMTVDGALGTTMTLVPDWPDEAEEIILLAQNERKMKKAAAAIYEGIALKPWAEIQ